MTASFSESFVLEHKKVKLRNPLLVVGLPGVGFVSKMAVDSLVKELKAEKIGTLYSPHFPNQVLALKSGKLKSFSMKFYVKKLAKRDLVLLKGDLQPITVEGQHEVSSAVLRYFASLGGTDVVAMAGYAVQSSGKEPSVYGYFTSKRLFEEFKKLGVKQSKFIVPIVGMAGLLPTIAKVYGLNGACLLVETSGAAIDSTGAKQLTLLLGKWLAEKLPSTTLEARAKKAQTMLRKIEEQARKEEASAITDAMPTTQELLKKDVLSYIH